jgi:hypothetical protein
VIPLQSVGGQMHMMQTQAAGANVWLKTPGSSFATPSAAPRALPQLLEALGIVRDAELGIGSWFSVSRQKAWAELIPGKPGTLSPSDHALLHVLEADGLEPAQQEEWLHRERGKLAAAALTKDERAVLRRFAFEPSQTVDGMLRALDGHDSFRGVGASSMPHAALYDFIKKREGELPAILPLKGDREFLLSQLKRLKDSAKIQAASPIAEALDEAAEKRVWDRPADKVKLDSLPKILMSEIQDQLVQGSLSFFTLFFIFNAR